MFSCRIFFFFLIFFYFLLCINLKSGKPNFLTFTQGIKVLFRYNSKQAHLFFLLFLTFAGDLKTCGEQTRKGKSCLKVECLLPHGKTSINTFRSFCIVILSCQTLLKSLEASLSLSLGSRPTEAKLLSAARVSGCHRSQREANTTTIQKDWSGDVNCSAFEETLWL